MNGVSISRYRGVFAFRHIYFFFFACACFIFSCKQGAQDDLDQKVFPEKYDISKVTPIVGAAPVINLLTPDKTPQKVPAGKPKLLKNPIPQGIGIPRFKNYGTDQGMAINNALCIFNDSKGNLWFGTNGAGVIRYDGHAFTNFASGIAGWPNFVKAISEDRDGNIWIGTWGAGLLRYDGYGLTPVSTANGLVNDLITSILVDSSGSIWVATDGGGISVIDPTELPERAEEYTGKLKAIRNYTYKNGLSSNQINSLDLDKYGNIWIGTQGSGMSFFNGKTFSHYSTEQGLLNPNVWSVLLDAQNRLWVASEGGVQCFLLKSEKFDAGHLSHFNQLSGLPEVDVRDLFQDRNGNIWIAAFGNGVYKYTPNGIVNYTMADGLSHQVNMCITEDNSKNLWFGSWGGGITRYDGEALSFYTLGNGTNFGTAIDWEGRIWNANFGDGAFVNDGENLHLYSTESGLAHNSLNDLIVDRKGRIWFATEQGLSKFDGDHFTNFTVDHGLPVNRLNKLAEDSSGNIWIGTYGGGLSKFDLNVVEDANQGLPVSKDVLEQLNTVDGKYVPSFTNYSTEQGLPSSQIWGVSISPENEVWIGSLGGASRLGKKGIYNLFKDSEIGELDAMSTFIDNKARVWVGTPGRGVYIFDGDTCTHYTTKHGLGDNVGYVATQDVYNNIIWLGTNKGLTAFRENPEKHGEFLLENFNKGTGFPINDLNSNSLLIDKNHVLWGACGDGYMIRFDYGKINRESKSAEVQIQKVQLHNEDICWSNLLHGIGEIEAKDSLRFLTEMVARFKELLNPEELKIQLKKYAGVEFEGISPYTYVPQQLSLDHKNNNISFDFNVSDPTYGKQMKYQFILEGYTNRWSPLEYVTHASFGNIREGTYTFKVKAQNPFGVWSPVQSYTFKVLPPWWRSIWAYILYTLSAITCITLFIRWRLSAVEKEKDILEEKVRVRTSELQEAKEKVEISLEELRAAQDQLIQSEKMASLGELTAGIAHEIQNPLNFVNNFSEINTELIDELNEELEKGNLDDVKDIAKDIKENEQKINHHGKRADAIVKGMLQHSRNNSGEKELTDINALADEYMRLAYHGLRAKDKSFNATLEQDLDESIGKILVVPQDIGRVILNLFTNAFHSVTDKLKTAREAGDETFKPTVSVSTKLEKDHVVIRIRDNGKGIPKEVRDKIFQPFFTTKPTGQGTGLGLSLSFDIITKVHKGKISVDSEPNEFAEFIITLPV